MWAQQFKYEFQLRSCYMVLCKFIHDFQLRSFRTKFTTLFSLRKSTRNFKLRTKFSGVFQFMRIYTGGHNLTALFSLCKFRRNFKLRTNFTGLILVDANLYETSNCELNLPALFSLCKFIQDFQLKSFRTKLNCPFQFMLCKFIRQFMQIYKELLIPN